MAPVVPSAGAMAVAGSAATSGACADQKPIAIAPLPSAVGQRPGPWAALVQGKHRRSFGPLNSLKARDFSYYADGSNR